MVDTNRRDPIIALLLLQLRGFKGENAFFDIVNSEDSIYSTSEWGLTGWLAAVHRSSGTAEIAVTETGEEARKLKGETSSRHG